MDYILQNDAVVKFIRWWTTAQKERIYSQPVILNNVHLIFEALKLFPILYIKTTFYKGDDWLGN